MTAMTNEVLLSAQNLSVRFGGVLAVNNVSFDVRRGEVFTLIGPNGAGKTTVFNLISRIYTPTTGTIAYAGPGGAMLPLTDQPPHKVAGLGIARTFQNIELFEHASVLHNLLIGRHTRQHSSLWAEMFFTRKVREGEVQAREKAEQVIDFLDLQHYRDTMVAGLPYGVRQVLDYVARGEVDAGFVYRTDAKQLADKVEVVMIVEGHDPVSYPIAVATTGKDAKMGQEFLNFVLSPEGQAVLAKYGFSKP